MAKEETKKLSYEELENAANALMEENRQLKANLHKTLEKLKEFSDFSMFKRLDYLFKVVELKDTFDSDFVISCVEEIQECIYPQKEENNTEEK